MKNPKINHPIDVYCLARWILLNLNRLPHFSFHLFSLLRFNSHYYYFAVHFGFCTIADISKEEKNERKEKTAKIKKFNKSFNCLRVISMIFYGLVLVFGTISSHDKLCLTEKTRSTPRSRQISFCCYFCSALFC